MLDARNLLTQMQLTEAEIDVYLVMLKGAQSAREVINSTGRSRPTAYYALSALERRGLITKQGNSEEYRYQVEPLSRLKTILQEQEDTLVAAKSQLEEFIQMNQDRQPGDHRPQIAFYEGLQAVKNIIMESLYCHSRKIDSLVPSDNFFWQLGPDFVEHYVALRQTLGITTRNLWGKSVPRESIEEYYQKAQLRQLPDGMGDRFRTTIFMYDDAVLYVSSLASGYALVVRSREHSEMMRVFYDTLWGMGKDIL
jgi:sugar-specific transcriptional regulator TrmB